jgi:ribosomal protein S18 acetylase RimI-like enzyme
MMADADEPKFVVRRATPADLPSLGRLGAGLLRAHYDFDPLRFLTPPADVESGYACFLGSQMKEDDACVLVADAGGDVVGYVYAGLEPMSWKELREPAGIIHDVAVAESHRGRGIGEALVREASDWLRDHGAPRVLLWTAQRNAAAQRLFSRLGFRPTMIEMTREL